MAKYEEAAMLPNFLLVGCPKCGTTSVAGWLSDHPDCYMPERKELFYFMDNPQQCAPVNYWNSGLDGYRDIFEDGKESYLRFEATTHYFYQKLVPELLSDLMPVQKVMVMLRHPSDRLYSWYQFNVNHLANLDPSLAFSDLVNLLLSGNENEVRPYCKNESTYESFADSLKNGIYADYLPNWHFLKNGIKVVLLDDLHKDKKSLMIEVSEWLGLDAGFFESYDFRNENVSYQIRLSGFHAFARSIALRFNFGSRVRGLLAKLYWGVQVSKAKVAISDEDALALTLLDDFYNSSIKDLSLAISRPDLPELWSRNRSLV